MDLLANIIQGRCSLTKELLFNKKFDTLGPADIILTNVVLCEAKNIVCKFDFCGSKILIDFVFDIIITYEYYIGKNIRERLYNIVVEKVTRTFKLDINDYGMTSREFDIEMRCVNKLHDIIFLKKFEGRDSEFEISVFGTLESIITKESVVNTPMCFELYTPLEARTISINSQYESNIDKNSLYFDEALMDMVSYEPLDGLNESNIIQLEKEAEFFKNKARDFEKHCQTYTLDLKQREMKIIDLMNQIEEKNTFINMLKEQVQSLEVAMMASENELSMYTDVNRKDEFINIENLRSLFKRLIRGRVEAVFRTISKIIHNKKEA